MTSYLRTEAHYRNAPVGTLVGTVNGGEPVPTELDVPVLRQTPSGWLGLCSGTTYAVAMLSGRRRRILRWGQG